MVSLLKLRALLVFFDPQMARQVVTISAIVFQVAVYVLASLFIGSWIGEKAGSKTLFQITFTLIGLIAGIYRLISFLKKNDPDTP